MKTLVIVTHPNLNESRINKAWFQQLEHHNDITIHQLYKTYPNEVIDVAREQTLLEAHDRIILQYPFYWYSTPPLLKKWFDSVLQYGWAYGPGGDKMQGKEIGIAISTYGSKESYTEGGSNLFSIEDLTKPIQSICNFISARFLPPFSLSDISNVTDEELEQSKLDYVKYIRSAQTAAV